MSTNTHLLRTDMQIIDKYFIKHFHFLISNDDVSFTLTRHRVVLLFIVR